jgi:hypothetical protein
MYQPPKQTWTKEDIPDFYTLLQPYIQGLKDDVMKNFSDIESAVTWWDNHEDINNVLGPEVSALYEHKVQTFNAEQNKFEVNPDGIRFRSLVYTFEDELHNIHRSISNPDVYGTFNAAQYSSAYNLAQLLDSDCVNLHYTAVAPRTIKFRTIVREYAHTDNHLVRIIIPLFAPESGAAFHMLPGGELPRVDKNRISEFKELFVHDVHKFTEIYNDSDSWLVFAAIDVPRTRLGLPEGEKITRDINSFSQVF